MKLKVAGKLSGMLWDDCLHVSRLASVALRGLTMSDYFRSVMPAESSTLADGAVQTDASNTASTTAAREFSSLPEHEQHLIRGTAYWFNAVKHAPDNALISSRTAAASAAAVVVPLFPTQSLETSSPSSRHATTTAAFASGAVQDDLVRYEWSSDALWSTILPSTSKTTAGTPSEPGGDAYYGIWICRLVYCLIRDCYALPSGAQLFQPELQAGTSLSSTAAAGGMELLSNASPVHCAVTRVKDAFMPHCLYICLHRVDLAEALFPVIIHDVIRVNGVNSHAFHTISTLVVKHLLSPLCAMRSATQLACRLLTFLLRQDVADFLKQWKKSSSSPRAAAKREPQKSATIPDWVLPFSYVLSIDYRYAAAAATRCQYTCTALLFVELAEEAEGSGEDDSRQLHHQHNQQQLVRRGSGAAVGHALQSASTTLGPSGAAGDNTGNAAAGGGGDANRLAYLGKRAARHMQQVAIWQQCSQ